ncbi:MAG: TraB domain-containing protein [Methanomassiliicoccaceae archaeon]|jgi:pheromone shutdown protein TraB|nr:TraB domain-containing protein [Methanomassiliicoccaceae archaeon]
MITLLGTGHVFKIAEPVSFIVKNMWPDAVLVELDPRRYNAISSAAQREPNGEDPWAYRKMAKYQRNLAEEYGSQVGAEFVAAVETGKAMGAAIEFIDKDANQTMKEVWEEMRFRERMRFTFSMIGDRFSSKRRADKSIQAFTEDEEYYFAEMRKKYPTLVRKLIDERNEHMTAKIKEAMGRYGNILVVIGDGHVEGIASSLGTEGIRKIRLKTLMDTESMNLLRKELWSGKEEGEGE